MKILKNKFKSLGKKYTAKVNKPIQKQNPIAIQLNESDLNKLINKRSKIYAKANYQIKCDKLSKLEITKKIIELNEKK